MMPTKIEWADETWNPFVGCERVSEGCDGCYAITTVGRNMAPQHKGLTIRTPSGLDWNGKVHVAEQHGGGKDTALDAPTRWRKPRRIFVNSLSDLFYGEALAQTVTEPAGVFSLAAAVIAEMIANPRHTFLVLSKRPQAMATALNSRELVGEVNQLLFIRGVDPLRSSTGDNPLAKPGDVVDVVWPPHIIWVTSIELNKYAFRANHLRRIQGTTGISAEPLLGPLPDLDLTDIDWLVVGGESGRQARPMHPQWVRDLRDACSEPCPECEAYPGDPADENRPPCPFCAGAGGDRIGPAFFFKQWGEYRPMRLDEVPTIRGGGEVRLVSVDERRPMGGWHLSHQIRSMIENPHYGWQMPVVKVGKKKAGRDLDGRTWDELPEAAA